jgi:hypothetical protein
MGKDLYTAKQFIEAIKGSGGIISAIAARVGCEWSTAKKYIENYPTVAAAYADECEAINDLAESTLIRSIKAGDTADAKWWLSRKRKDAFTERHEIEHINVRELSDEELESIVKG